MESSRNQRSTIGYPQGLTISRRRMIGFMMIPTENKAEVGGYRTEDPKNAAAGAGIKLTKTIRSPIKKPM